MSPFETLLALILAAPFPQEPMPAARTVLTTWQMANLIVRIKDDCHPRPQLCRVNPLIHDWYPGNCWQAWSVFDEDADGEPLFTSCVSDNIYEFGAMHVFRKFGTECPGRGSPNSAASECEFVAFDKELPPSVVCATALMTEDGEDVERVVYARCETWIHCGYYGNAYGDCCTYLFEEPGVECRQGSELDWSALADKFHSECFQLTSPWGSK